MNSDHDDSRRRDKESGVERRLRASLVAQGLWVYEDRIAGHLDAAGACLDRALAQADRRQLTGDDRTRAVDEAFDAWTRDLAAAIDVRPAPAWMTEADAARPMRVAVAVMLVAGVSQTRLRRMGHCEKLISRLARDMDFGASRRPEGVSAELAAYYASERTKKIARQTTGDGAWAQKRRRKAIK